MITLDRGSPLHQAILALVRETAEEAAVAAFQQQYDNPSELNAEKVLTEDEIKQLVEDNFRVVRGPAPPQNDDFDSECGNEGTAHEAVCADWGCVICMAAQVRKVVE